MLGPARTSMVINCVTDEIFAVFKFSKLSMYTSTSKDTHNDNKSGDGEIHFLFCYFASRSRSYSV